MITYDFPCGCKIPVIDEKIKESDGLPSLQIDYHNLNHKCPLTWQLFCDGRTKGIFQLEKSLGQHWSKSVKPVSVEELSALIALIRPGCLKAITDGKNMTQHYVDRKNGEDYKLFNPQAEPILGQTFGIVTYQEQSLALAKVFAGFDLAQADILRRAIGKKKADVMAQLRNTFVDGCVNTGIITEADAIALFDIIEKSNRYSFNKAHSVGYAETGYWCGYAKAHFPLHFFCSWLSMAKEKTKPKDEVAELVKDARAFGIETMTPSIFKGNENFQIEDGKIRCGIGNVSGVGTKQVQNFIQVLANAEQKLQKKVSDFSWYEILLYISPYTNKTVMNNLIGVGAMSNFGMARQKMLFEYQRIEAIGLTPKELEFIHSNNFTSIDSCLDGLQQGYKLSQAKKQKIANAANSIKNPPSAYTDNIGFISSIETDLIGISITCSKLDGCDTSSATLKCDSFNRNSGQKNLSLAVQIDRISEWRPPNSQKPLLFMTVSDDSGSVEAMVPADEYEQFSFLLFNGNTVLLSGFKNKKGNLTVKKVSQI